MEIVIKAFKLGHLIHGASDKTVVKLVTIKCMVQ